jgi:hypothetical protein
MECNGAKKDFNLIRRWWIDLKYQTNLGSSDLLMKFMHEVTGCIGPPRIFSRHHPYMK